VQCIFQGGGLHNTSLRRLASCERRCTGHLCSSCCWSHELVSHQRPTSASTFCSPHTSAIVAYAPTNEAQDEVKDVFYDQLASAVSGVPSHDILLVLSNLNAVTGWDRVPTGILEAVIGGFGSGIPNDNIIRLLSFCASFGLAMTGSWFRRRDIQRWTWYQTWTRSRSLMGDQFMRPAARGAEMTSATPLT